MTEKYLRDPGLVTTEMDGDLVMMSIEAGAYFGVGGIGPRLWELLAEPVTIDEMVAAICAEYDVDAETCRPDIQAFVDDLAGNKLVRVN